MPFFEDANKPQIRLNQILLQTGEEKVIELNEVAIDYDNTPASILKDVRFEANELATVTLDGSELTVKAGEKAGKTVCTISVISNSVRVEKEIRIDITSDK